MLDTLRLNSSGKLVQAAQYLTKYTVSKKATDTFSDAFFTYIQSWQKANNLDADGIIGPKTWTKIVSLLPTCSTSKNAKSEYTCGLQTLLGGIVADGIFGTKTKNAVAAFQTANGLKADGICGPKTWSALILGVEAAIPKKEESGSTDPGQSISGDKVINNCVHYLQWDSKWKKVMFSNHGDKNQTIGNSGCGPSSMAQIMATFIDSNITPVEMCKIAIDRGHRSYNSGTNWSYFKDIFSLYPQFSKFVQTKNLETLKAALREGALAVCSMNSGDGNFWTKGGLVSKILAS